jgi:hypothetical protein
VRGDDWRSDLRHRKPWPAQPARRALGLPGSCAAKWLRVDLTAYQTPYGRPICSAGGPGNRTAIQESPLTLCETFGRDESGADLARSSGAGTLFSRS